MLALFIATCFLAQAVSLTSATPSVETCAEIPGWKVVSGNHEQRPGISEDEADNNFKNIDLHTCCDYKDKCKFQMRETLEAIFDMCTIDISCKRLESGGVKIGRKREVGLRGWLYDYCDTFDENHVLYSMEYCQATENCLKASSGKDDLLPCLRRVSGYLEHTGFFSATVFPYKEFEFVTTNLTNRVTYKLNINGTISQTLHK